MSGFLRRIAAQAMGVANPVRTVASSPFAGTPALVEESLPVIADTAPVASVNGTRVDHGAAVHANDDSPIGQLSGGRDRRTEPPVGSKAEWPKGSSQQSAAAAAPATELSINARAIEPSPLLSAGPEAGAMSLPVPERGVHVDVEKAVEPEFGVPAPSGSLSIDIGPTELLLPPRARQSVARGLFDQERVKPERWPAGNRAATLEETTEVHVSIGRIEVTAVHEAPPPKRVGPRRPAPMSLDDYLSKRQGGRS